MQYLLRDLAPGIGAVVGRATARPLRVARLVRPGRPTGRAAAVARLPGPVAIARLLPTLAAAVARLRLRLLLATGRGAVVDLRRMAARHPEGLGVDRAIRQAVQMFVDFGIGRDVPLLLVAGPASLRVAPQ